MRSSGCTIQQALTQEAATVVKLAVSLARRRGHAQVTPLHVANAMLSSSSSGLFKEACLQSHSHPLQCRALELCFNVALNRLPTSTSSSPMLGGPLHHHHLHPSISNALVAAFKRAQAHQRRGSIENHQQHQQQPILAVKIELEQLIISILDDPSVSRVMREAGFSSPLVKSKVEQAMSIEVNHNKIDPDDNHDHKKSCSSIEDVSSVIEGLLVSGKRRKCCVVVGECIDTLKGTIKGVSSRIERGEDVQDALKHVKFEPLSLDSFESLSRDEIEEKVAQITRLVETYANKGLILYLGDLTWAIEFRKGGDVGSGDVESRRCSYYCPVEHMIMELKRLVYEFNYEAGKLWVLGVASFQTYTRFGSGHPSLEAILGFHAITIPAGSLGLSLIPESDSLTSKRTNSTMSWLLIKAGSQEDRDNGNLHNNTCNSEPATPRLPSWLQKYKDENKGFDNNSNQDTIPVKDLCKSWSFTERTLISGSSLSPPPPSEFLYDRQQSFNVQQTRHLAFEVEPKCFWISTNNPTSNGAFQTTLSMYVPSSILKSSSTPNTTSSSDAMEMECNQMRFKDFKVGNLESLCKALEKKVPRHKDIIRNVASTILSCRSRRLVSTNENDHCKEETWFFFLGDDIDGKEKIARELARLIFGSEDKYISIGISSFSSTEDSGNKRLRNEQSFKFADRLMEEVSVDPHRVFFVEDIDQVDYVSQVGIKRAIERGKLRSSNGDEISFGDAIIILSCERFSSRSNVNQHYHDYQGGPREDGKAGCCSDESNGNSIGPSRVSLDLNISISDDYCSFDDKDQPYVDELGILTSVDKCILFKHQPL